MLLEAGAALMLGNEYGLEELSGELVVICAAAQCGEGRETYIKELLTYRCIVLSMCYISLT